ncbi:MAG: radical SAM protein [Candidatus Moranbacteria bacterium]|nr:radical SAM protein [Candidatus Moranbacteria bacterium]
MNSQERYNSYKFFLSNHKSFYDNFFLTDLIRWFGEECVLSAGQIRNHWNIHLDSKESSKEILNFYVHIPFCRSKCNYCPYFSKVPVDREIESYLKNLKKQISFFREVFKSKKIDNLYIGGGTPSILSEKQLMELVGNLKKYFSFEKRGEKTFEGNPESIDKKKLKIIKDFGFNRISFGVQSLDKNVLNSALRGYQEFSKIKEVIQSARKLKFEINVDLMVGLRGDDASSILSSFSGLADLRPDSIIVYRFRPPNGYFGLRSESFQSRERKKISEKFRKIKKQFKAEADKHNYEMIESKFVVYDSIGYKFLLKNKKILGNVYNFSPSPSSSQSLFALGSRANAYIFKDLQYYYTKDGRDNFNFNSNSLDYKAVRLGERGEMRNFILQKLSHERCFSRKGFAKHFGADFKEIFADGINGLKKIGKIRFQGDRVFFPEEPIDRFAACMFFFSENDIRKKMIEKNNERKK